MVESLNTRADLTVEAIAFIGFPKYGKIMIGDVALEFFNDKSPADNMQFPWPSIKAAEGRVSRAGKIDRNFYLVLNNGTRVRFGAKDAGKILKLLRDRLGNDKVVKTATFTGTFLNLFKRNKKS